MYSFSRRSLPHKPHYSVILPQFFANKTNPVIMYPNKIKVRDISYYFVKICYICLLDLRSQQSSLSYSLGSN